MMLPENLDENLKSNIYSFVEIMKEKAGENLVSVILYGGVAKLDYTVGKSNTNILLVFNNVDLMVLDHLSLPFQKAMLDFQLAPFILTTSEIEPSSDVFAVKLFDIKKHHHVLYGKDLLNNLDFEPKYLKFISEQELRNQLSRMKFFYIQNFNLPEQLLLKVQKGFTTLIINANIFLYLKHNVYYATRKEITEHILREPEMDISSLKNLLTIKNGEVQLSMGEIKTAYDQLMVQYKQLIKAIKHI